jgi:hypothetical protein
MLHFYSTQNVDFRQLFIDKNNVVTKSGLDDFDSISPKFYFLMNNSSYLD